MKRKLLAAFTMILFALVGSSGWSAPAWSFVSQSKAYTALTADDGNLMRKAGASFAEENNSGADLHENNCTLTKLQDGATSGAGGELVTIGDNATFYLKFPNLASVRAVRIYAQGKGRSGIGVTTVYAGKNGVYTDLGVTAYAYKDDSSKNYFRYTLANSDNSFFATDCDEIKIQFGTMHNNGTLVHEIEVEGEITGSAKTFTVRFLDKDGAEIAGSSQTVEQGADATPPEAPAVEGYSFVKWNPDYRSIAADTDCQAVYRRVTTPYWTVAQWDGASRVAADGNLMLAAGALVSSSAPTAGWGSYTDPTLLNDGTVAKAIIGTVFSAASDTTLTCQFAGASDVSNVVIYAYINGGVSINRAQLVKVEACIDDVYVDLGAEALDAVPTSTDVQCYVLENAAKGVIAANATALLITLGTCAPNNSFLPVEIEIAGALKEAKTYTVEYFDADGHSLKKVTGVEPGAAVEPPVAPTVEGQTFLGWDGDSSYVVSDLEIHPIYVETGKAVPVAEKWSGNWSSSDAAALPCGTNLLTETGVAVSLLNNTPAATVQSYVDPYALVNGSFTDCCGIGSNAIFVAELPYAQSLDSIILFTANDKGRDGFEIVSIEYKTSASGAWRSVKMDAGFTVGMGSDSTGNIKVTVSCPDGVSPLMEKAVAFRINFGQTENNGLLLREILAFPHTEAASAWRVSTWDTSLSPVTLPPKRNLLRQPGASVSFAANYVHDSIYALTNNLAALTDGQLVADIWSGCYPVGRQAVVDLNFNGAKKVERLRFTTYFFGAARDLIGVREIYVRRSGSASFERIDSIPPFDNVTSGTTLARGALVYELNPTEGEALFRNVTGVRVFFDAMANDCCTFAEVEAFESPTGFAIRVR